MAPRTGARPDEAPQARQEGTHPDSQVLAQPQETTSLAQEGHQIGVPQGFRTGIKDYDPVEPELIHPEKRLPARPQLEAPAPSFPERLGTYAMKEVGKEFVKSLPLASLGTNLVQKAIDLYREQKIRDIQDFAAEVSRQVADEGAEFGAAFEESMVRPEAVEAIRRGVKAAMEIDDPEVLQCLAHLTGRYAADGKRPDMFFKNFVHFCEQIDPDDFQTMKVIATAFHDLLKDYQNRRTSAPDNPVAPPGMTVFQIEDNDKGPGKATVHFTAGSAHWSRAIPIKPSKDLIKVLSAFEFAVFNNVNPRYLKFNHETAKKLSMLFTGKAVDHEK